MRTVDLIEEIQDIKVRHGIQTALIERKLADLKEYEIESIDDAKNVLDELQKKLTGLTAERDLLVRRASKILSFYEDRLR